MTTNQYPGEPWRKSRHSNGQAECVEVAQIRPGNITVRDSKDPDGTWLTFGPTPWLVFAKQVKIAADRPGYH